MNSEHAESLSKWIQENASKESKLSFATYEDITNADKLRSIIGDLMKSVNEASSTYKQVVRNPTPEVLASAQKILSDLENWRSVQESLKVTKAIFQQNSENPIRLAPIAKHLLYAIHYLERASFSPNQIESFRTAINRGSVGNNGDFPEEVNQGGMEKLLRNSIYNLQSGGSKTMKVIREVLQNAVDATDPNTKPELASRKDWTPEIRIDMESFKTPDGYKVDISIDDKGIGMDWQTLSRKFFVTFESGKTADQGAAGGFGIAKALIQDAPEHGWSVETNSMHSSRFHKNLFFGTRRGDSYEAPSTEIKRHGDGTMLVLHGLPIVSKEEVKELCKVYATNGRVKIVFNGEEQSAKFTLSSEDVKPIGSDSGAIVDMVASDDSEREVAKRVLSEKGDSIAEKIEEIGQVSGSKNKYKFYLKKAMDATSGKLYVMVNGQYQFHETVYIPKLDLIVSVETVARPGDNDYPLDPGREYLRGDVKKYISELVSYIRDFADSMLQDELFKDGVESIVVNPDADPMTIKDEDSTTGKSEMLMRVLGSVTGNAFRKPEQTPEPYQAKDDASQASNPDSGGSAAPSPPNMDSEAEKQEIIEQATKQIVQIVGDNSAFSAESIKDMVKDVIETSEDRVEQNNKIKSIIDGLSSPGHILIQKNFVAKNIVSENAKITGEMLIVWQKAIKIIIRKVTSTVSKFGYASGRPFVPGLIYSDEALGLFMPAKSGRKFDSICVNPVTLSAHLLPKMFKEKLESDQENSAFDLLDGMDESKNSSADTPTNRVAKFIFHLATHEVCHFLHPDGYSPENFHRFISKIEIMCHDEYEQIRREVKIHMKGLRKSAEQLIKLIAKHRGGQKKLPEFSTWAARKGMMVVREFQQERQKPARVKKNTQIKSFRDFI